MQVPPTLCYFCRQLPTYLLQRFVHDVVLDGIEQVCYRQRFRLFGVEMLHSRCNDFLVKSRLRDRPTLPWGCFVCHICFSFPMLMLKRVEYLSLLSVPSRRRAGDLLAVVSPPLYFFQAQDPRPSVGYRCDVPVFALVTVAVNPIQEPVLTGVLGCSLRRLPLIEVLVLGAIPGQRVHRRRLRQPPPHP